MQRLTTTATALLVMLALGAPAWAKTVEFEECLVREVDQSNVAAEEQGLLLSVSVRDGEQVTEGQVVAQIDKKLLELQLEVSKKELEAAQERAKDRSSIDFAISGAQVKASQYRRLEKVNQSHPGTIADTDLELAYLEWNQFDKQIVQAKANLRIADSDAKVKEAALQASEEHIRRCDVKAPWTGVVEKVQLHRGDWVRPGDAILTLVRMDRLRVSCPVKMSEYLPEQLANAPVTVTVKLAGDRSFQFTGKVTGFSAKARAIGQSLEYDVWAEVENRQQNGFWLLRPQMRVNVSMELP